MDIRTTTLLCAFCLPQATLATLAAQPETMPVAQTDEEPEEIIVTGRRMRYELRLEMESAERVVYNLFNELNDEPRFEISCTMHAITGTTRKSQVCQTEFERRALSLEGQDYLAAYRALLEPRCSGCDPAEPYITAAPSAMSIAPQQRELQGKMREIAETHPEFVDALVRFVDAKGRYDQSRGASNDSEEAP
jgi:hypothetical protein